MDQSDPKNYLKSEEQYFSEIGDYFSESGGTYTEKTHAFTRFVPRQSLSYFLARNEIFKEIIQLHGSILDFGTYRGSSFFSWLQLSATYEPYNHIRNIIGFDSFQGFSDVGEPDHGTEGDDFRLKRKGGMAIREGADEIRRGIDLFDLNRPLGHVKKGKIVQGELPGACETYLNDHQETVIALANFGLGLYAPTVELLRIVKPRLQQGSVIVFEDLNQATWPGETKALFDVFDSRHISLKRVPFCPHISWMKIENQVGE